MIECLQNFKFNSLFFLNYVSKQSFIGRENWAIRDLHIYHISVKKLSYDSDPALSRHRISNASALRFCPAGFCSEKQRHHVWFNHLEHYYADLLWALTWWITSNKMWNYFLKILVFIFTWEGKFSRDKLLLNIKECCR